MENVKVLLVDDDKVSVYLLEKILRKIGIKNVEVAFNGLEALKLVEVNQPDYIFLDISMPIMGGLEFLDELNERKLCSNSIVLMLTSFDSTANKIKTIHHRKVKDFIEKPLTIEKLKKIFEQYRASA